MLDARRLSHVPRGLYSEDARSVGRHLGILRQLALNEVFMQSTDGFAALSAAPGFDPRPHVLIGASVRRATVGVRARMER
jgi:hypothetical protein